MSDSHNYAKRSAVKGAADWAAVALATLLSFTVYSLTTNPGVGFHDSAELALRASQLGATHAPGAPLHTLLGFALGRIFGDPVTGTNLLSIAAGSLAAGIVCLLLLELIADRAVALAGALIFALAFPIWGNSVITETYSLNLFILTCCVLAGWRWRWSGEIGLLLVLAILYGLALGAHFASIILLPAFIFLIYLSHPEAIRNTCIFCGAVLLMLCSIAFANFLLTANVPPFGRFTPDTSPGLFLYMSGSEHDPLKSTGILFYIGRIVQHAAIFSRHYLFVLIPVGILGLCVLIKRDWIYGSFLALIFAFYMGYFTLFGPGDYDAMVGPSYFVFSLWIATGIERLMHSHASIWIRRIVCAILPAAVILMFTTQFPGRYADANSDRVELYAEQAIELIPENSIVIAGWREFTVLNYYQQIYARRPDLKIIVPAQTLRHYPHGDVADYRVFIDDHICERPVVTNKLTDEILTNYDLEALAEQSDWHRIVLRYTEKCAL